MNLYSKPKNLQEAYENKANLYRHSLGVDEKLRKGEIGDEEAKRYQSTINGVLSSLDGTIRLMKSKEAKPAKGNIETPSSSVGSSTSILGAKPQNINIYLERLGDITITGTTMEDDAKEVRAIWSKELLEVLNDANAIAAR
mgnify:FL=1